MKKAIYPGSFDPLTLGHMDLIQRAASLVSELTVLISVSSQKQALFTAEERQALIQKSMPQIQNLKVDFCQGLTTDYMKSHQIQILVRGLRQVEDFEYEKSMAQYNLTLLPSAETLLLYANPGLSFISSRGVKEVAKHAKSVQDLKPFVSDPVAEALFQKMKGKQA